VPCVTRDQLIEKLVADAVDRALDAPKISRGGSEVLMQR
jgi:hypothetical protein